MTHDKTTKIDKTHLSIIARITSKQINQYPVYHSDTSETFGTWSAKKKIESTRNEKVYPEKETQAIAISKRLKFGRRARSFRQEEIQMQRDGEEDQRGVSLHIDYITRPGVRKNRSSM
jgi:hypothetical protein